MRIAHVVTLVSPDGAYGGPVRVATNLLGELATRGHSVRLFAAHRGYQEAPDRMAGVPLTSFRAQRIIPGTGFAGITSAPLLRHLAKVLPTYDVVHVHLARDLVTLPAARLAESLDLPVVLQTHGMIDRSSNPLSRPLDALLTRPVLRQARQVLYLTDREKAGLGDVTREDIKYSHLPNGVPGAGPPARSEEPMEVLYLARLQARKRPGLFVDSAVQLAPEFPHVAFRLVGPDEGEGPDVLEKIRRSGRIDVTWEGPLAPEDTLDRMRRAAVYVLPSVNEPFPMSVLEAASIGLPSVVTESCGLAGAIRRWDAGIVVDESGHSLTQAVRDLLADEGSRREKGQNARLMVQHDFSVARVAQRLEEIYARAMQSSSEG